MLALLSAVLQLSILVSESTESTKFAGKGESVEVADSAVEYYQTASVHEAGSVTVGGFQASVVMPAS